MKYINRESDGHTYTSDALGWRDADPHIRRFLDGHTYWRDADGEWMAAPTQTDGTPDLHCASYVVDFEEHIAPEDYAALTAWLRTAEAS